MIIIIIRKVEAGYHRPQEWPRITIIISIGSNSRSLTHPI